MSDRNASAVRMYVCDLHPDHGVTIKGEHYLPACCGRYMNQVASAAPITAGSTCSCGCRLDNFDLWWDTERTGRTVAVVLRGEP